MVHDLAKVTQVESGTVRSEIFFSVFYTMLKISSVKMSDKKEKLRMWIIHSGMTSSLNGLKVCYIFSFGCFFSIKIVVGVEPIIFPTNGHTHIGLLSTKMNE